MAFTQIFISDLHLQESEPDITSAFTRFMRDVASGANELYILGDLFEVWLGDDHRTDFNTMIAGEIRSAPGNTFLMHGNRDFLIGDAFCKSANATLLTDPTVINEHLTPLLLMHGDSLCTRDVEYMTARKQLRSPEFQADFLNKSIEERAAFAAAARGESQAHTRQAAEDIMDVTPDEVVKTLRTHGVTQLLHGHTHRPGTHTLEVDGTAATRYVLGDWRPDTWYLEVTDGKPELREFNP